MECFHSVKSNCLLKQLQKLPMYSYPEELVELNGKKYKKSDLEAALSKLNPVEE